MRRVGCSSPECRCQRFCWVRRPNSVWSVPWTEAAAPASMRICTAARIACAANARWAQHSNRIYSGRECRSNNANDPNVRPLNSRGEAATGDWLDETVSKTKTSMSMLLIQFTYSMSLRTHESNWRMCSPMNHTKLLKYGAAVLLVAKEEYVIQNLEFREFDLASGFLTCLVWIATCSYFPLDRRSAIWFAQRFGPWIRDDWRI